jgi:hypothetical protein
MELNQILQELLIKTDESDSITSARGTASSLDPRAASLQVHTDDRSSTR